MEAPYAYGGPHRTAWDNGLRYALSVSNSAWFRCLSSLLLLTVIAASGCRSHVVAGAQATAAARAEMAQERQELEQVPPPSKNRYMTVHTYDSWENPYITVQPDMLTVHIIFADQNPSTFGSGGMLRPVGARRQEINISLGKLGEAMSAIPASSWPYGRVVAVEEAHHTPGKGEPAVRRNMENAVSVLNDLGIVAYDLNEGNLR